MLIHIAEFKIYISTGTQYHLPTSHSQTADSHTGAVPLGYPIISPISRQHFHLSLPHTHTYIERFIRPASIWLSAFSPLASRPRAAVRQRRWGRLYGAAVAREPESAQSFPLAVASSLVYIYIYVYTYPLSFLMVDEISGRRFSLPIQTHTFTLLYTYNIYTYKV